MREPADGGVLAHRESRPIAGSGAGGIPAIDYAVHTQKTEIELMKWVTREHPKTDRIACPWLIRKYIDPQAEILYVPDAEVLPTAAREGATSFDAPGAQYTHRDGLCSFEVLIADHQLTDPALPLMARIVHGADIDKGVDTTAQSAGLLAISHGFAMLDLTDQEQLDLELPVYDALYAWCQAQVTSAVPA